MLKSIPKSSVLNQLKLYLSEIYHNQLEKIILFGSQVRGDETPESDFDILIILRNPFAYYQEIQKISEYISELCLENDILITCCFTTLEKWNTENSAFYRNIHQEGMVL
ncbi:MAG: nucleotidyltransferase domain-containing protein [Snowella sp.]|nr:nucleotidyltransferase domain-containing protein [Snowella sp.]